MHDRAVQAHVVAGQLDQAQRVQPGERVGHAHAHLDPIPPSVEERPRDPLAGRQAGGAGKEAEHPRVHLVGGVEADVGSWQRLGDALHVPRRRDVGRHAAAQHRGVRHEGGPAELRQVLLGAEIDRVAVQACSVSCSPSTRLLEGSGA
jgi:hypothetical protein